MLHIKSNDACCGCYACVSACPRNCITMQCDIEGFGYPQINTDDCIDCGCCESVCPILNKPSRRSNGSFSSYAAFNKNDDVRFVSSSGGIFALLAEAIIEKNGVVFGAAFNDKFEVEHVPVDNKAELYRLRGSKYVQSKIGNTYAETEGFLKLGRVVLFTGTPCQIAGLKAYLRKEYDNLICQDIICHGVPSPAVWDKYIRYREKISNSKVKKVAFRNKTSGWRGYFVQFVFEDDTEYLQPYNKDLYMNGFLGDYFLRPSCYNCCFKDEIRISDITLADFWGVQNLFPGIDDDKGTSLVIVHSAHGQSLIDTILAKTESTETSLHDAIKYNSAMIKSAAIPEKRSEFFYEIQRKPFEKVIKKYCSSVSIIKKVIVKIKNIIKQVRNK